MSADFTGREVHAPAPDIHRLPDIQSLRVVRVRFRTPVEYAAGADRRETDEAIEFQVTTSEDFPTRALAPALFVGDVAVTEGRQVDERQYRFVAYGRPPLTEDAPISVGWVGSGVPQLKPTGYRFHVEGEEER